MQGKRASARIYRGHSNPCWKLSSIWERNLDCLGRGTPAHGSRRLFGPGLYKEDRDATLRSFRDRAANIPEVPLKNSDSENDWWAFGRHFGLRTPLLDWSRSPYVAAFWAFASRLVSANPKLSYPLPQNKICTLSKPVVVWELSCPSDLVEPGEFDLVNNVRYGLHRQRSQLGLFTRLEHKDHIDVESYLECRGIGSYLYRFEIPCAYLRDIFIALSDLDRMSINFAHLYPDPEGAARQANLDWLWDRMRYVASDQSYPMSTPGKAP